MFLVANISGNEITISDLNITIKSRQAIDLHKIDTKISPEKSKDLHIARKRGAIKLLFEKTEKKVVEKKNTKVNDPFNKDEIMKELKDFLKKEINTQNNNSSEQVSNIIKELGGLLKSANGNKTDKRQAIQEETDVDNEKIQNIHAKAMKRIAKNTKGSVGYAQENVADDSISKNAHELENLA